MASSSSTGGSGDRRCLVYKAFKKVAHADGPSAVQLAHIMRLIL